MLAHQTNTLALCIKWEDVKEGFGYSFPIPETEDCDDVQSASIEDWKLNVYGQCWSFNRPAQYMMEEYADSPVIAMSTVGKVFEGIYRFTKAKHIENGLKVGPVVYCVPEEMPKTWKTLDQSGTNEDLNQNVLGYYLRKQLKYIHENEMRILLDGTYILKHPVAWKELGIWKYDITVEQLLQQVVLPSNASAEAIAEIREAMTNAGIGHRLTVSDTLKSYK